MLAAAALRLAAIETLRPHAVVAADTGAADHPGYPTLARHRVFDSRAAGLQDLDRTRPYTPVLSVHAVEAGKQLRGPMSDAGDLEADASIEVVAELARHDVENDVEFAAVMAESDPTARLVLEALVSQVEYALDLGADGHLFRSLRARLIRSECLAYAVPQFGLRFHRITLRRHYEIRPERFDGPAGQLPQPMHTLFQALPEGSYARAKLAELAALFGRDALPALDGVHVTSGPVSFGLPGAPQPDP